jgi:DNA polymerase-3 subunit beta
MKIVVNQASLVQELALIQGIIERKSTIPILSNVLLNATENGRLALTATDLDVGFRSAIAAEVDQPGTAAVDARRLHDIARRLPPGEVSMRLDEGALRIECERIRYKLAIQDAEQFPSLPVKEGKPSALIRSAHLADMVRRVLFAITTDDPRYSLGGSLWRTTGERLTMVATDGHRLSLTTRALQGVQEEIPDMVVPRKALAEIGKLAAEDEQETYLWSRGGNLFVQVGERELNTHLQELRFPDYDRVIPQQNNKEFRVATGSLRAAIERVSLLSQEQSRLIRLDLSESALVLAAQHHQHGEAREELPVDYEGQAVQIGFNFQYLVDFLAVAGTDEVTVRLGEGMSQGLLEPTRPDDDEREDLYVVMPMALG